MEEEARCILRAALEAEELDGSRWLARLRSRFGSGLILSSLTVAELYFGIFCSPKGRKRESLEDAVQAMVEQDFAGRILPFGVE